MQRLASAPHVREDAHLDAIMSVSTDMRARGVPPSNMSCLADTIVPLRCVRGRSGPRRTIGVVRRRSGPHGLGFRETSIGPRGVAIGDEIGTEVPE